MELNRPISFVVICVLLYMLSRLFPLSVRRDWFRIAVYGQLQKSYGGNAKVFYLYGRYITVTFTPFQRLMNGLALVLVALLDWLGIVLLVGLLYSLIIGNR